MKQFDTHCQWRSYTRAHTGPKLPFIELLYNCYILVFSPSCLSLPSNTLGIDYMSHGHSLDKSLSLWCLYCLVEMMPLGQELCAMLL